MILFLIVAYLIILRWHLTVVLIWLFPKELDSVGGGVQVYMESKRSISGGQESSLVTVHISFWGRVSLFQLHWLGDKLQGPSCLYLPSAGIQVITTMSGFCVDSGHPHSSSCFCIAGTLSPEPSPLFLVGYLYFLDTRHSLGIQQTFSLHLWCIFAFVICCLWHRGILCV